MAIVAANAEQGRPRVLVYERIDPSEESLNWLAAQGIEVERGCAMWDESYHRYTEDEIIAAARGRIAVMGASGARFTRRVLEELEGLRFISKFGIGVDNIDLATAARRGIVVSNSPDEAAIADVAEHAIALMLALKKNLSIWNTAYVVRGGWRPGHLGSSLDGNTVGLIGFGRIGRAVAQRLKGWNVRLMAFDPYVGAGVEGVRFTDLATLLAEADIISIHAAPNESNRHLIDAAALQSMKRESILINTGRASLVDPLALAQALETGQLAGAAVDVFEEEPPDPGHPLFRQTNLIATPHVAAWTRRALLSMGWRAARNLHAMIFGLPCDHIVQHPPS